MNEKLVDKARDFAVIMHKGQYRKNGQEYINHPMRVANNVLTFKKSNNMDILLSSAYLHDTLEDTQATYDDLVRLFGNSIASLVLELTNDKEKVKLIGKTNYLSMKMKNMSNYALCLKLCDRLDNVSDLVNVDQEFRHRYIIETSDILKYLINNRDLSNTQLMLALKIVEYLDLANKNDIDNNKLYSINDSIEKKLIK